jgi:hypothetical protein
MIGWGTVVGLLLLPALAMRFSDQVVWTPFDFMMAGALLIGGGLLIELVIWRTARPLIRLGMLALIILAVLVIWADGAVGLF